MQAIILAAGMGKRLGKYTKDRTKCMVLVNGKTLIEESLDKLNNNGITKLTLVVGYKKESLVELLGTKFKNIDISYIDNPIYDKTNNIYSLYLAKEVLFNDDTLLLESDLIFDDSIIRGIINDKRPNLAVVDKFESWMDGTVVKTNDNDDIISFISKSGFDFSHIDEYYKTVNIYKFSRDFSRKIYIPFLEAYLSALGNNEYYEQVLKVTSIIDNNGLQAYKLNKDKWYEIDDIQDKLNAETIFAPIPSTKLEKIKKIEGGYWRYPTFKNFSCTANPYFPTKQISEELRTYFLTLLSESPSCRDMQNLLAGLLFNVEVDQIVTANSTDGLIRALSQILKGSIGVLRPSFVPYLHLITQERIVFLSSRYPDFTFDSEDLDTLSSKSDNVFLMNPGFPTGQHMQKDRIINFARNLDELGKYLVVDETYLDFIDKTEGESLIEESSLRENINLIVIRNLSICYGIPGIGLGIVATANKNIIRKLKDNFAGNHIDSVGEYLLQNLRIYQSDYKKSCENLKSAKNNFLQKLQEIPFLRIISAEANYYFCELLCGLTSKELTELLIDKYDIIIDNLADEFDAESSKYFVLSVRSEEENNFLFNTLKGLQQLPSMKVIH